MPCFILDIRPIFREDASGEIQDFASGQAVDRDSNSISGKSIVQITGIAAIGHTGIEFQSRSVIRETTVWCADPGAVLRDGGNIPATETAPGKQDKAVRN